MIENGLRQKAIYRVNLRVYEGGRWYHETVYVSPDYSEHQTLGAYLAAEAVVKRRYGRRGPIAKIKRHKCALYDQLTGKWVTQYIEF